MRILIIDTYYEKFLRNFYNYNQEKVKDLDYKQLRELLFGQFFGTSNFYSKNLKKLGIDAEEIIFNDSILQIKWAQENGLKIKLNDPLWLKILNKINKKFNRVMGRGYLYEILLNQIENYKPDILYIQSPTYFSPLFLKKIKRRIKLLIAQISSPLPPLWFFKSYDLVISSLPNYVEYFRKNKINSEYLKLAFEPEILNYLEKKENQYPITFVGSFTNVHKKFIPVFEEVFKKFGNKFFIWGFGIENTKSKILVNCYQGEAFGLDMYNILYNSKITLNRHGENSENYANNMRLYEATGCGSMLITDYKDNLNELFKIGEEIEIYRNTDELIDKISFYLENEDQRKKIAEAGQKRTLTEHNYENRMRELLKIIEKYF
ncbi:MAG: glycosyltransferase [Candidatus Omnitrophica bacterium]|nr:glycosyltransferase [Candidatus Omnitrophota bacterium]